MSNIRIEIADIAYMDYDMDIVFCSQKRKR